MVIDAIVKLKNTISDLKIHSFSNNSITIREPPSTPLNHVIINGLNNEVIGIQFDKLGFADKTFISGYNARRGCDAVIFCELDGEGYILILDLKSSIPSDNNHIPQLVSGDCFTDYLLAVLDRFEQIKISKWQRRYFIFHCANNQRTTLPNYAESPPNNTKADKAHILQVTNGEPIPLRKLLQKPL